MSPCQRIWETHGLVPCRRIKRRLPPYQSDVLSLNEQGLIGAGCRNRTSAPTLQVWSSTIKVKPALEPPRGIKPLSDPYEGSVLVTELRRRKLTNRRGVPLSIPKEAVNQTTPSNSGRLRCQTTRRAYIRRRQAD